MGRVSAARLSAVRLMAELLRAGGAWARRPEYVTIALKSPEGQRMKLDRRAGAAMVALSAALQLRVAAAQEVEVLHWWTAGGEAAALQVLKEDLQREGIAWKDMPVAGSGGTQAMTVLRARVTSGNPPTAVQLIGFDIIDWAELGVLADLDALALAERWDAVVPEALQRFSKFEGRWIAAPVNFHSTNWIWANKAVLDAAGADGRGPARRFDSRSTWRSACCSIR
jgi:glucose/mannose transport system substrate-binding protein